MHSCHTVTRGHSETVGEHSLGRGRHTLGDFCFLPSCLQEAEGVEQNRMIPQQIGLYRSP